MFHGRNVFRMLSGVHWCSIDTLRCSLTDFDNPKVYGDTSIFDGLVFLHQSSGRWERSINLIFPLCLCWPMYPTLRSKTSKTSRISFDQCYVKLHFSFWSALCNQFFWRPVLQKDIYVDTYCRNIWSLWKERQIIDSCKKKKKWKVQV